MGILKEIAGGTDVICCHCMMHLNSRRDYYSYQREVDDIKWYKPDEVNDVIARENNCSGMHWDKCREYL